MFKIGLYQPKDTFTVVPLPVVPLASSRPKEVLIYILHPYLACLLSLFEIKIECDDGHFSEKGKYSSIPEHQNHTIHETASTGTTEGKSSLSDP